MKYTPPGGIVDTVVAGANVTVNDADPANPVVSSAGGTGLDQLTGDVTAGPGTGSQVATLAAVGAAGTVGDASHYPIVTTDAKGRVTSMTAQAIAASPVPIYSVPNASTVLPFAGTLTLCATSPTLPIGTYLVTVEGIFRSAIAATLAATHLAVVKAGTATALIDGFSSKSTSGQTNVAAGGGAIGGYYLPFSITGVVVVTVAGTIIVQGEYVDTANNGSIDVSLYALKIA